LKKVIAIATMVVAGSVMADSITLETQGQRSASGSEDTRQYSMSYKRDLTKSLVGDVYMSTSQGEETKKLGARLEVGLTPSVPLFGNVSAYTRVALGSKYTNDGDNNYYVVEPGVQFPIAGALSGKVGYRWRSATSAVNGDQTHTTRIGLSYALTKNDAIGVRYDRQRGDTDQNNLAFSYVRSF
jgi:hypothetical protein